MVRSTEWKSEEIWRAVRSTEWKSEEIGEIGRTAQQESNPWPANLYLGFSKNEHKENGSSYAMKPGSHEQDANGDYIYFEMGKKNATTLRLVLDETKMVQAKAESGAKTKGERSYKLLKQ